MNQAQQSHAIWSIGVPDAGEEFDSDVNIGCWGTCDQVNGTGFRVLLKQKEQGVWVNKQTTTGTADVEQGVIMEWAKDLLTPTNGWNPGAQAIVVLEYNLGASKKTDSLTIWINDEAM